MTPSQYRKAIERLGGNEMTQFQVTIQRVVTTKVNVEAETASAAAKIIREYGISEAATDMAKQDASITEIISRVDRI
jgi:AraC-like DNA-binding protein